MNCLPPIPPKLIWPKNMSSSVSGSLKPYCNTHTHTHRVCLAVWQQGEAFPKDSGGGGGGGGNPNTSRSWGGCVYRSQSKTDRALTVNTVIDILKKTVQTAKPGKFLSLAQ